MPYNGAKESRHSKEDNQQYGKRNRLFYHKHVCIC